MPNGVSRGTSNLTATEICYGAAMGQLREFDLGSSTDPV
jgi:hypothetical protein